MLRNTAAVRALEDGCRRLDLPNNTATELLHFLSAKRVHDSFVDSSKKKLNMSPGATVDKLWHFMLLNTAVCSQVHELLGGVVEHRGIDHTDLPDDTKLLQRLYSLNVMRLEGLEPDVTLWTEPGTAMHTVQLTSVSALQHLPGGTRLYVTPTINQQRLAQLLQALDLLYADNDATGVQANAAAAQQAEAGRRRTRQQVAAAAATAAAVAPKRARHAGDDTQEQLSQLSVAPPQGWQQQRQGQQVILNIIVKDQLGGEVHFKVKHCTRIATIKKAYAAKKSLCMTAFRFLFDGDRLEEDKVIGDYDIWDGETIDATINQTGC